MFMFTENYSNIIRLTRAIGLEESILLRINRDTKFLSTSISAIKPAERPSFSGWT